VAHGCVRGAFASSAGISEFFKLSLGVTSFLEIAGISGFSKMSLGITRVTLLSVSLDFQLEFLVFPKRALVLPDLRY
jgi:hypothetical protein